MVQKTVNRIIASNTIGEFWDDSVRKCLPYAINSSDATNNVIGRYFTSSDGVSVSAGGEGAGVGVFVGPKTQPNFNGDLTATTTVPNNVIGEFCTMGRVVVNLGAQSTFGAEVNYTVATGALGVGAGDNSTTKTIPNAFVLVPGGSDGLCVVEFGRN